MVTWRLYRQFNTLYGIIALIRASFYREVAPAKTKHETAAMLPTYLVCVERQKRLELQRVYIMVCSHTSRRETMECARRKGFSVISPPCAKSKMVTATCPCIMEDGTPQHGKHGVSNHMGTKKVQDGGGHIPILVKYGLRTEFARTDEEQIWIIEDGATKKNATCKAATCSAVRPSISSAFRYRL